MHARPCRPAWNAALPEIGAKFGSSGPKTEIPRRGAPLYYEWNRTGRKRRTCRKQLAQAAATIGRRMRELLLLRD
jgi:hypothetical protein